MEIMTRKEEKKKWEIKKKKPSLQEEVITRISNAYVAWENMFGV